MSRIRERGTMSHWVSSHYCYMDDDQSYWKNHLDRDFLLQFPADEYEFISDETPRFQRYGNCYHKKVTTKPLPTEIFWHGAGGTNWESNAMRFASYMNPTEYVTPDPTDLIAQACNGMKPTLTGPLSLTNFILELRDLKLLFRTMRNTKRVISKLLSIKRKPGESRTRALIRTLASLHLGYQFGVKPFIGDLITLFGKLTSIEETLRLYKSQCGVVQTRHWQKTLVDNEISRQILSSPYENYVCELQTNVVFNATMQYTYTVPEIDSKYAKLKGILDLLGLKVNASVIWEAIPFSFVVDWFVGVDDFLSQFDTDYLEAQVTILDFCYSFKVNESVAYLVGAGWSESINRSNRRPCATVDISRYTRRRTLPDPGLFGLELVDGFGARQVGLGAALLLA